MSTSILIFVVTDKEEDYIPLGSIKEIFEPYIYSWCDSECSLEYPDASQYGSSWDEVWFHHCETNPQKISSISFFRPCNDIRSLDLIAQLLKIEKIAFLWNNEEHLLIGNINTKQHISEELIAAVGEHTVVESGADIYRECGFMTIEQFKASQNKL